MAYHNSDDTQPLVTVKNIQDNFWKEYGRHYYCRYDYDGLTHEQCNDVMTKVTEHLDNLCEFETTSSKLVCDILNYIYIYIFLNFHNKFQFKITYDNFFFFSSFFFVFLIKKNKIISVFFCVFLK